MFTLRSRSAVKLVQVQHPPATYEESFMTGVILEVEGTDS